MKILYLIILILIKSNYGSSDLLNLIKQDKKYYSKIQNLITHPITYYVITPLIIKPIIIPTINSKIMPIINTFQNKLDSINKSSIFKFLKKIPIHKKK